MADSEPYAIVVQFQTWRLLKTTREHPEFASMDDTTLTAPDFLALSTFDKDTQIDFVKKRAEQFFVDLVCYHLSDAGLAALGMAKPSLNADLLELIQDTKISSYFQAYAPLWLLQAIYHYDEGEYTSQIKGGAVENRMFALNRSNVFIRLTMMIYHIALKQLVPAMLPFIYWSDVDVFQARVRNYFKDVGNTTRWLIDAIKCQNADVKDPSFFDSYRFSELKTKLDLLQPNNRLSNDLLGGLQYALLAYYATKNLINNPLNRNIVIRCTEIVINRIVEHPENNNNAIVNTIKTTLAYDTPTLITKLSNLMNKAALEIPFDQVVPIENNFQSTAKPYTPELLATTDFAPLKDNADFARFANAVYCTCHVGVLAYGILNGEDESKVIFYDPSLIYIGAGLFIYKYADALDQGRIYSAMGEFLRSLTNEMAKDATDVFSAYKNFVPRMIHINTRDHILRLIPSFYILTRDQQAFQLFNNLASRILDWGQLVINLHRMDENEIDNCIPGLFTVLKKCACAGPSTALILGNGLYGLSVASRVYPQLEMTAKNYEIACAGQTDISTIPDRIGEFIESVDEDLTIDYDNLQIDHDEWESYYESLDPRIQKGLDILMHVTSGDWTKVEGSTATIPIARPSTIIAMLQFSSDVLNNPNSGISIDVTSALNNKLMTLGGMNTYPWPVGTSIAHARDWSTGCSITQEIVQPGFYEYDIRARIRGAPATALIHAPATILFIVPL
ncbi:hypothetical protein PPL_06409 [Heterostelium album PN500]|uniref:Uncharacterized protein n=1 Tax=Heterostelium pallidum (strain ATCC 26659 / Pp 5 / PN500) TaxID=670386 RepID=D3BD29_HETP5|nr:hypothetical protein PPL_06409 [Heterostelium album PN500]EFA80821.1 hypothetical protein PPL_06409 [Heterostelium album PN500]|eukprot:XP_020432940.1 hypothetical protein PPL_06409 [Heterostelium album PN500]